MIDPEHWRRWPLLLGAAVCLAVATVVLAAVDSLEGKLLIAMSLIVLGASLMGAFVYSEGTHDSRNDEEEEEGDSDGTT